MTGGEGRNAFERREIGKHETQQVMAQLDAERRRTNSVNALSCTACRRPQENFLIALTSPFSFMPSNQLSSTLDTRISCSPSENASSDSLSGSKSYKARQHG